MKNKPAASFPNTLTSQLLSLTARSSARHQRWRKNLRLPRGSAGVTNHNHTLARMTSGIGPVYSARTAQDTNPEMVRKTTIHSLQIHAQKLCCKQEGTPRSTPDRVTAELVPGRPFLRCNTTGPSTRSAINMNRGGPERFLQSHFHGAHTGSPSVIVPYPMMHTKYALPVRRSIYL